MSPSQLDNVDSSAARELAVKPVDVGDRQLFGISELAEEFGVSTRTIRYYESKRLLAPARVNGARVYTRRDRTRLAMILRAKAIGYTLAEIRHYLDLYGEKGEGRTRQLEYVVQRTAETIAKLEAQQAHIAETLKELRLIHDVCVGRLAATNHSERTRKKNRV